MIKFLFTLAFLFFILVSLLGFSVARSFRTFLFGDPRKKNRQRTASQSRQRSNQTTASHKPTPRKKIISEKEGEYIDYEEIKD
jgi:hypothetical protein